MLAREQRAAVPLWCGGVKNIWIGVAHAVAGRRGADLLIVFGVPATIALLLRWQLGCSAASALMFFAESALSAIDSCAEPAMLSLNR